MAVADAIADWEEYEEAQNVYVAMEFGKHMETFVPQVKEMVNALRQLIDDPEGLKETKGHKHTGQWKPEQWDEIKKYQALIVETCAAGLDDLNFLANLRRFWLIKSQPILPRGHSNPFAPDARARAQRLYDQADAMITTLHQKGYYRDLIELEQEARSLTFRVEKHHPTTSFRKALQEARQQEFIVWNCMRRLNEKERKQKEEQNQTDSLACSNPYFIHRSTSNQNL